MELRRRKRRRQTADAADANGAGRAKAGDYYAALSRRMGIAKWAMIVALPVFLAVMLSVYRSNITYDNLKYLMRDFSSDRGETALKFTDISFEEQTSLDSLIFRGELAVVGSSNVTLYNSTGDKTFDYRSEMENPAAVASDKYILCYDLGGTHYSIFTNLTRVLDTSADAVIENASMSDKGAFLLVKRARDAKYTVSLYDSSFRNKVNYYKSRFVADAAISPDGKHSVIVTLGNAGADVSCSVELYDFGASEPRSVRDYTGYLPVSVSFFADGSFALVCDTRIIFFGEDGNERQTYLQKEGRLSCVDFSESSLCAAYFGNVSGFGSDIILFDNQGNIMYNIETDQKLSDIVHNKDYVFALGADAAYRFSRADGAVLSCPLELDTQRIEAVNSVALAVSASGSRCVFADGGETDGTENNGGAK